MENRSLYTPLKTFTKKGQMNMKSKNYILLGNALLLFGIACLQIEAFTGWGITEVLGIFSPFVGIALSVFGAFKKD